MSPAALRELSTLTIGFVPVSFEMPVGMPDWAKVTFHWVTYVPVMVAPASAEPSVPLAVLVRRYCLLAELVATGVEKVQLVPSSQKRVSSSALAANELTPTLTTVLVPV